MPMIPFCCRCPEVREIRAMIVYENASRLPAGRYIFMECYCDDPECDCRRVLLRVFSYANNKILL